MKEENSRAGLNTAVVIAKCVNPSCGWEVQEKEDVTVDTWGNITCPMCGKLMAGEIN